MQTSNELMNSSEEFRLLVSNQPLNAEQRAQLEKDIQIAAAANGLTVEKFIFYLSENLKPGMFNPGDISAGVPASTVGVNLVGNDGTHVVSGVDALERIFHEYGHAASGPGKESDATALGSFASWYGKNILSFLYGVDMTGQTQTVDNWVNGNTDASLLWNNALAWNMAGSGTTENREDYIDRHISEPEKIAAQLQRERLIYGNAVEKGLAKLDMLLDAGEITPDEYGRRAGELLIAYNANIHAWNARLRVVGGVASMIGGVFVAGGGSVGSGGTGAVASIAVGGGMWVYGFDEIKTGAIELFTGKPALSSHEQIVMGLTGLSAEDAKTAVHAYGTLINLAGVVQAPRVAGAGMLDVASTSAEAQLVLDKIAAAQKVKTAGATGKAGTGQLITNVERIAAAEANAGYSVTSTWHPPYAATSRATSFVTTQELEFVRVSTVEGKEVGRFLVRPSEIAGMTPAQIQTHLALPYTPELIQTVKVPAGSQMTMGRVGAQPNFGFPQSGGIQYQIKDFIPGASFGPRIPLK